MQHYTYAHLSTIDNSVFYIGKGQKKRAYVKGGHNAEWKKIADQGYKVEILAQWNSADQAYEHERFLVACAKDLKWPIVNVSEGGKGYINNTVWLGKKHSEESLKKMSIAQTGIKRCKSIKYTLANAGANNPKWKGRWITPEGIFDTAIEAAKHHKIDAKTVRARCKGYKEILVNSIKQYPPKSGWSFEEAR